MVEPNACPVGEVDRHIVWKALKTNEESDKNAHRDFKYRIDKLQNREEPKIKAFKKRLEMQSNVKQDKYTTTWCVQPL